MNERFYICTLLSDLVVNSSLATEGNMDSLDFIPGSSILGIVAKIYNQLDSDSAYTVFHTGKVSFGDARISINHKPSYVMPLLFFTDKVKKNIGEDSVYLGHLIYEKEDIRDSKGGRIQPQQVRSGYFSYSSNSIDLLTAIPKKFSLKSAHDRNSRTSKSSQMFGMEALPEGLRFIFSVRAEDESLFHHIETALIGNRRLGKSKSAEFGQVDIQRFEEFSNPAYQQLIENVVLVYAESNLCFFDDKGMPTYQPTVKQLGLDQGEIIWEKSQIRTYEYANWNSQRQTNNATKYCIARGSVFFVSGSSINKGNGSVGEWQVEGLGRVLYNPEFLSGDSSSGKSSFSFVKADINDSKSISLKEVSTDESLLLNWLENKKDQKTKELELAQAVYQAAEIAKSSGIFVKVSSSQWGTIREYATHAKSPTDLAKKLFDNPLKASNETDGQARRRKGYLMHGVSYDKIWSSSREKPIKELLKIFEINQISQSEKGCEFTCCKSLEFIAKFAAEMAQSKSKLK